MTKYISFINRQINQICEGGLHVLYKKVKKLSWLLFMNIFALLAVWLKADWPKAYGFVGKKNIKRLKKLYTQANPDELAIKRTGDLVIRYFKTIADRDPVPVDVQDWIEASRILEGMYFFTGEINKMNAVLQKTAEVQRDIAKAYQFDDLGIEFLSEFLAVGSIGTYEFLDTHVKSGILGLRPSKKMILLVNPKASVNNPCYLNYWRRYITIISDPRLIRTLSPLQKRFEVPLNSYMTLNGKTYKSFLALGIIREQWIKDKRKPILTISDEDYARGWQCLKSFGMRQGDWFVCLHVREGGWKDKNSLVENFRNANIQTYIPAIKAVTDAGGWVVRMGDSTMEPLPEMPKVIDYAHSDEKSDWMDVFLCAQSRFFVGTSSGLFIFAITFGTPIVATNFMPTCCAYYLTSADLFIPRACKFKREDRFLNFNELFSPKIGTAAVQSRYDQEDIEIIENSEEEIKSLVGEMLRKCDGNLKYSEEDEGLQGLFRSVTLDCGKLYGEEGAVVNARIGKEFLRKHAALLPSREGSVVAIDIK